MEMLKRAILAMSIAVFAMGCGGEDEGSAEEAGKAIDEAVSEGSDTAEGLVDSLKESVDE